MTEVAVPLNESFLCFLLEGGNAFVNAKALIEDLSAEGACREIRGSNHTIARVIAHLDYWQNWFYAGAMGSLKDYPETNELSFPQVNEDEWGKVKTSFLKRLEDIKGLCGDEALLNRSFSQGESLGGGHDKRTVAETMLYTVALHNAHHYGQIITLRQLMNIWPPEAGGVTW